MKSEFTLKNGHYVNGLSSLTLLKIAVGLWLIGCTLVFCVSTLNWPLVNDASLMHYVTFLIDHGFKPYRDILDPNMPGSYLIDWTVIHTLGAGARGSRLYDLLLLVLALAAMFAIAWHRSRFAALYAACLFALFHGRDGMAQVGQRDLAVAVGLLGAIAFAILLARRDHLLGAIGLGFTIGLVTFIKPYALLSLLLFIPLMHMIPRARRVKVLLATLGGLSIPLFAVAVYLIHFGLVQPFLFDLLTVDPLHAHLGFPGPWYLIKWCMTPSLLVMSIFGLLAMRSISPSGKNIERSLLLTGIVVGLIGYFSQLKGFPYHRYPLVACLFLFVSLELTEATKYSGKPRFIGVVGLSFGVILAPLYVEHAFHSKWPNNMEIALERDLNALGGGSLSGKIQCIDSINGCSRVLYDMRLVQSTGVMYDEFLFPPNPPLGILHRREIFLNTLKETEPEIIVITPNSFPAGPKAYGRLLMWPDFNQFLSDCYDKTTERVFPHGAPNEPGYRVYKAAAKCRT